ncbi:MAG: DUF4097 family beta strand repeat protein [bacterium]|nr:DUF4097 family beta strand repeat protein [bacterium]MCP4963992.1 DUF4097 family beta strand repeat protein [bacterium]
MSDRKETFQIGESVRIVAATRSGDITVVGGEPGSVRLAIDGPGAAGFEIDQLGDVISIEPRRKGRFIGSSADIVLTVPTTATLELSCTSGDITVQSPVFELRASVASGDVRVSAVETACRINSASGDIKISKAQDAEINTASGTVRVGSIGRNLRLNVASGNVYADEIGESAICKVASSDVRISAFMGTEIRHKSMAGDLHLGLPPHRTIEMDFSSLSGRLRNKLPKGDGGPSEKLVSVSVVTVSGNLTLLAATN